MSLLEFGECFLKRVVDADRAEMVKKDVPKNAQKFFVGRKRVYFGVFMPGEQEQEKDAIKIAVMVANVECWFVGKVFESMDAFDEKRDKWPKDVFGDAIDHGASF